MQLVHSADWQQADPAPRPIPLSEGRTLGLHAIARLLGVWKRSENWKKRYIEALIETEGFPDPLPMLHGERLSTEIHPRKSQWLTISVRGWFLSKTPAQAIALVGDAEEVEAACAAANRLDGAADNLFDGEPS